ncbi:MAG: hypothetical protein CM15mP102_20070 [Flavobacteriales bacterium]|nr:MAG: hypothetical protein CM15mP102_20070 [Flavobacteriales bacterium]
MGGIGILFEQASSEGIYRKLSLEKLLFLSHRNQYISGMTTVMASVENKESLKDYQGKFLNLR